MLSSIAATPKPTWKGKINTSELSFINSGTCVNEDLTNING